MNLPFGLIAVALIVVFLRSVQPQRVRTDWLGLVLLGEANIINIGLMKDRNFAVCTILIANTGVVFLGYMVLAPDLYVGYYGWEIVTAGYAIGISALGCVIGTMRATPYIRLVGTRFAILTGLAAIASGWYLFSRTNLNASPMEVIILGMVITFGLMLSFPVIAAQAFSGVPARLRDEAAGLFNLLKTIGFSVGVTCLCSLIYRGTQRNWNRLGGFLDSTQPGYDKYLQDGGFTDGTPEAGAYASQLLSTQSGMLTYMQTMEVLIVLGICTMPFVVFLRMPSKH